jgi:ribonucleoside-diphosphate reductase alpha chain
VSAIATPSTKMPPVPLGLETPHLSENAQIVLQRRYLGRGEDGQVNEDPQQMFWRVAWHIAQAEARYEGDPKEAAREYYNMMARLEFLPASPTLMNAGRRLGQLSACFVLPIEDSLESIFTTLKHAALVHQSGGGTGFDFSPIRPRRDFVHTTHGVASGPLSFLRIYNATTEEIKQGGTRRGANMGVLRIDHPDIEAFIAAKQDTDNLQNFNISVAITDAFLQALEKDTDYPLINPRTGKTVRRVAAKDIWQQIAQSAWQTGEPGILFIDRANADNPVSHKETIHATNPCSEQFLAAYDSCNLGSIDLARHVRHEDAKAQLDWDHLAETIHLAVRFLDDVIDINRYPVAQIREKTLSNRRIGLGIMGFSRLLFALGIPYDSQEGRDTATRIMAFVEKTAHHASQVLAEERGVFPNWDGSTWEAQGIRMRHAAVTTIAPTGTIGMIADTSGGCEPEFSLVYVKRCLDGTVLDVIVPEVATIARREGFWRNDLIDELRRQKGSIQNIDGVPKKWKRVFRTAHEITPEDHVRMQAAFQAHVDNAVSKTINLPPDATVEDVEAVYRLAHRLGLKGLTVYRQGSRPLQVLDHQESDPPTGTLPEDVPCGHCEPVLAHAEP